MIQQISRAEGNGQFVTFIRPSHAYRAGVPFPRTSISQLTTFTCVHRLIADSLAAPQRSRRSRGAIQCVAKPVKLVAEIAVQLIPTCFFVLGNDQVFSPNLWCGQGKSLNTQDFCHRMDD